MHMCVQSRMHEQWKKLFGNFKFPGWRGLNTVQKEQSLLHRINILLPVKVSIPKFTMNGFINNRQHSALRWQCRTFICTAIMSIVTWITEENNGPLTYQIAALMFCLPEHITSSHEKLTIWKECKVQITLFGQDHSIHNNWVHKCLQRTYMYTNTKSKAGTFYHGQTKWMSCTNAGKKTIRLHDICWYTTIAFSKCTACSHRSNTSWKEEASNCTVILESTGTVFNWIFQLTISQQTLIYTNCDSELNMKRLDWISKLFFAW